MKSCLVSQSKTVEHTAKNTQRSEGLGQLEERTKVTSAFTRNRPRNLLSNLRKEQSTRQEDSDD